jgi:5-methylcytosine-specific restriction endonuclease McrA
VSAPTVLRLCVVTGCGRIVRGASQCAEHQRLHDAAYEAQRPSRQERGYDSRWAKLARAAIAAQPWCTDCGTAGDASNPLTGDHRVPISRGGLSVSENVVVRCRRCNSRKGTRPCSEPVHT